MSYFPVVLTFTNLVRQKLLSDFSNVLKLPDFLHFCFQTHTEFFKNNFRNLIHQITDICRCGMIPVDHESTVFFGYLGAAYLKAAKSRILNQFSCKIPSGRLNVLPALGYSNGCLLTRFSFRSSMTARISSALPGCSSRTADTTRYPRSGMMLCR